MYMIMILDKGPSLVPYTGVEHDTKQGALSEYLEACEEYKKECVYVVLL